MATITKVRVIFYLWLPDKWLTDINLDVSTLTEQQERQILQKSIKVYKDVLGRHPKGYIAPSWQASSRTIKLLEENGCVDDRQLVLCRSDSPSSKRFEYGELRGRAQRKCLNTKQTTPISRMTASHIGHLIWALIISHPQIPQKIPRNGWYQ